MGFARQRGPLGAGLPVAPPLEHCSIGVYSWPEGDALMPITFETLYDTMTLIRAGKKEEIPFGIRRDPLAGRSITTHYSMAEIAKLIAYSNRVCREDCHKSDTIVFLEKRNRQAGAT